MGTSAVAPADTQSDTDKILAAIADLKAALLAALSPSVAAPPPPPPPPPTAAGPRTDPT